MTWFSGRVSAAIGSGGRQQLFSGAAWVCLSVLTPDKAVRSAAYGQKTAHFQATLADSTFSI